MGDRNLGYNSGRVIAGFGIHLHEGTPNASDAIEDGLGNAGTVAGGAQVEVGVYVKAVTAQVTAKLYGRVKDADVTGDWIQIGSDITQAAGGSSMTRFAASDNVALFNEFKVHWNATGGGATSQLGITLV